jgi:aspartate kinase
MVTKVFKFGGASVKDAEGIRNVAGIIRNFGLKKGQVIVVSAMGKTTNALEQILCLARDGKEYADALDALAFSHINTARNLFKAGEAAEKVEEGLHGYFDELKKLLSQAQKVEYDFIYDQVVSSGEYLSSFLLFSFLRLEGYPVQLLDAAGIIRTDDNWREGEVNLEESTRLVMNHVLPHLQDGNVLTQGFLGGTDDGLRTTLGREGSDYTAALMAYFLNAESVSIWKDVSGVLSADPKWKPDAVLLPELSYQDAAELTFYGATVIHPKTIRPLAHKKIPLYVRSFLNPEANGTLVGPELKKQRQESWIRKNNQVLVSLSSRDFSFMEEKNIQEVLQAFSAAGLKMQMLQVSATSISIVTDWEKERLEKAFFKITDRYSMLFNQNLTLITIQNPGTEALHYVPEGKSLILAQRTRSTLQLLYPEN